MSFAQFNPCAPCCAAEPSGCIVAYWKMDELSGSRFDSVNGHDLIAGINLHRVLGKINFAVEFFYQGLGSLSTIDTAFDTFNKEFTVAGWVFPGFFPEGQILNGPGFRISLRSTTFNDNWNQAAFSVNGIFDAIAFTSMPAYTAWHWLSTWVDRSGPTPVSYISIDNGTPSMGIAAGSSGNSGAISSSGNLVFGYDQNGLQAQFAGYLDGWGFWACKLTDTERTHIYNSGIGLDYPF